MKNAHTVFLRFLPFFTVIIGAQSSFQAAKEMKNLLGDQTIQINTTQDSVLELSNHWIEQAFSALIATVANEKISKISHLESKFHEKCVKSVKSIEDHAKCVSDLLIISRAQNRRQERARKLVKKVTENPPTDTWVGAFRIRKKRQTVVRRSGYTLRSSKDDASPFTKITKQITKTIRALKNKKDERGWRQIMVDVKRTGDLVEKRNKVKEMIGKSVRGRTRSNARKPLADNNTSDEQLENDSKPVNVDEMFQRLQDHPEEILKNDAPRLLNMTGEQSEAVGRIKLIRDAVKLGLSLGGQNVRGFDQKSLRFASPRFFAIAPEEHKRKDDTVNILSPSLFSLHDEGTQEEKSLSLPKIFDNTITQHDGAEKDSFMDLITEISGVADAVDDAAQKVARESEGVLMKSDGAEISVSRENVTRIYGEDNYRKMKVLEKMHGMYTEEQMHHFNKSGYAIMNDKQREMMYGAGAPFENAQTMKAGQNLTMARAKRALHTVIHEIGKGNIKMGKYEKRMKDIVGSPILFSSIVASPATASQALIMSPVLFTPIVLSPSIYGSVILSPWVFVPVILGPRILAPIIVSPAIFSPIVLSPLALDPIILVPGVANPIVLSPFLLSPFILSPQVMTPIILSPFALSPFILTPTALSPLILSPFVLSPSVLSPSFVTAVIMSPYALSPSVLSPPTMISVFASPSILS